MNKKGDITLIEVLVVAVVIAILAAVAIPAYQAYNSRYEGKYIIKIEERTFAVMSYEKTETGIIFEDMEGEKFEVIGSNIIIEKNDDYQPKTKIRKITE